MRLGIQGKIKATLNGRLPGTPLYIAGDDPRIADAGLSPIGGLYVVAPGVVENADGSYSPNTKLVTAQVYYKEYYDQNVEASLFDASFLKIREIRIEYEFDKKLLRKTPLSQASIALYGRNLFCFTDIRFLILKQRHWMEVISLSESKPAHYLRLVLSA